MTRGQTRWNVVIASIGGIIALVIALNWQSLMLGSVILLSEKRPRLLDDAAWDQPKSARQFQARFGRGTSERDLLEWLGEYEFTVDRGAHIATHRIQGLPCNELIEVSWHVTTKAIIGDAQAVVHEAGCL